MNTGIGDAINLASKLAAVLGGHAPDKLLDSYEAERIGFARRLVATTDRVFSFVTADGRLADIIRTRIAPVVLPAAMAFEAAREYLFRTVSQITLNYRGGPLSVGAAGHIHGGDRLPWVPIVIGLINCPITRILCSKLNYLGSLKCSNRRTQVRARPYQSRPPKVGTTAGVQMQG